MISARFSLGTWSPDNRFLLVDGADDKKGLGLFRLDPRSGDSEQLVSYPSEGSLDHAAWPSAGKSIVFKRTDGAGRRIVSRDVETGEEIELYRAPSSSSIGCLEASSDGQRLAFALEDLGTRTTAMMTMTVAEKNIRELGPRLAYPEAVEDILGLTPAGQHVLDKLIRLKRKYGPQDVFFSYLTS